MELLIIVAIYLWPGGAASVRSGVSFEGGDFALGCPGGQHCGGLYDGRDQAAGGANA
jgi:hypothetical protein